MVIETMAREILSHFVNSEYLHQFLSSWTTELTTRARSGAFLSKFNDLRKTCKNVTHLALQSKEEREEQGGPKEEKKRQTSFCTLFQKPETKRKYTLKK